ncbi:MAG: S41 family peptidase [Candidatus Spechtbacterales bacterium]
MKKALVAVLSLAMILTACTAASDSDDASNSFCPKVERTKVDFSVANDVVFALKEYSVFQDTAQDPEHLLNSGLETVFRFLGVRSSNIPQWARDIVEEEVQRANNVDNLNFAVLNDVVDRLRDNPKYDDLNDPSRVEELLDAFIRGIIDGVGDPFANYIQAEDWILMDRGQRTFTGSFVGMGVTLSQNSRGEISVSSVMTGSPAERSGLKTGDAILSVNGLDATECSNRQFSLRLRAIEDLALKLEIAREEFGTTERETMEIDLAREEIPQPNLATYPGVDLPDGRGSTLDDIPYRCGRSGGLGDPCPFDDENGDPKIFYIQLRSFTQQSAEDLRYVLENIDQSQFEGVVFDIRDNGGGLVRAWIDMANMLMSTDGYIRVERTADGVTTRTRGTEGSLLREDLPMAIIMNGDSYSASEALAAALRDNGRAVIVNREKSSGGKGTTNRYLSLRDGDYGALYVSIQYFLTPNEEMIEKMDTNGDGHYDVGGLAPDIHVPWTNEDFSKNSRDVNYDRTLKAALEWLEDRFSK